MFCHVIGSIKRKYFLPCNWKPSYIVIGSIKRKYVLSCNWKHQETVSVVMQLEASRDIICCHVIGIIKRKYLLSCN